MSSLELARTVPAHLDELLEHALEVNASDLHLAAGAPPTVRVNGALCPIEGYDVLTAEVIERLVFGVLNEHKRQMFADELVSCQVVSLRNL